MDKDKKLRQRILNLLKIVVSLGLLVILVTQVDVSQSIQYLTAMNWAPFLLAQVLYLGGVFVRAYRWVRWSGVWVWRCPGGGW